VGTISKTISLHILIYWYWF